MALNPQLVKSIKTTFARHSSDELRKILQERDGNTYSDEAFAAAEELLNERAQGTAKEPPPPPPPPTREELAAFADGRLRIQIRSIGVLFYFLACVSLLCGAASFLWNSFIGCLLVAVAVFYSWLGFQIRRFSPRAQTLALFVSMLMMLNIPIGTFIGIWIFMKLNQAEHLFAKNLPKETTL